MQNDQDIFDKVLEDNIGKYNIMFQMKKYDTKGRSEGLNSKTYEDTGEAFNIEVSHDLVDKLRVFVDNGREIKEVKGTYNIDNAIDHMIERYKKHYLQDVLFSWTPYRTPFNKGNRRVVLTIEFSVWAKKNH